MATPDTASRDKFMASLRQMQRQLKRRSAIRQASLFGFVATASAMLAQIAISLAAYFAPAQAFNPSIALSVSLFAMPVLASLCAGTIAYLKPMHYKVTARWADQILGGDTFATTLFATSQTTPQSFDNALLTRANQQLDAMPASPPLRLDRRTFVLSSMLLVMIVSSIVHWLAVAPAAINVEDERLIRVDPLNAAQGLLGAVGAPAQQAARALGMNETASAIQQAGALSELFANGELNQAEALAQLSNIETMLGDSQGLDALSGLLENEQTREVIEGFLNQASSSENEATAMGPELLTQLSGALGSLGLSEDALSNIDPELVERLITGKASLESVQSVTRARSQLLQGTRQLRQEILGESQSTAQNPTTLPATTLTRETTGKKLTHVKRDAVTSIERLAPDLRRDAERYLSNASDD